MWPMRRWMWTRAIALLDMFSSLLHRIALRLSQVVVDNIPLRLRHAARMIVDKWRRAHAPPTGQPVLALLADVELGPVNADVRHGWQDWCAQADVRHGWQDWRAQADVRHGWQNVRHGWQDGPVLAERADVELGRENDIAGHGGQDTKISNSK